MRFKSLRIERFRNQNLVSFSGQLPFREGGAPFYVHDSTKGFKRLTDLQKRRRFSNLRLFAEGNVCEQVGVSDNGDKWTVVKLTNGGIFPEEEVVDKTPLITLEQRVVSEVPAKGFENWWMRYRPFNLQRRIYGWRAYAENLVREADGGRSIADFDKIEWAYLKLAKQYLKARRWEMTRKAISVAFQASLQKKVISTVDTELYDRWDTSIGEYAIIKRFAMRISTKNGEVIVPTLATGRGLAGTVYKIYAEPLLFKEGHSDSRMFGQEDRAGIYMEMDRERNRDAISHRFMLEVIGLKLVELSNNPMLVSCKVTEYSITDKRSWLKKEFIYGPELSTLSQEHWNLSSDEAVEARFAFAAIL